MKSDSQTDSKIKTLRRNITRKVRQVGVIRTCKHGMLKLIAQLHGLAFSAESSSDSFDDKYGTDTAQIVSVGALDIPDDKLEHTNRYEAVVPEAFYGIMGELPVAHEEFVFIDVGSGKGRALLLASRLPFMRIVGVEISAALTEVALNNIRIFKDQMQKCSKIQAVCEDGAGYELPRQKTILYLNNPFDDQVMGPVVSSVEKSLLSNPRKLYVVYQRPLHRILWDQSKMFRVTKSAERHVIYESRSS